MSGGTRRLSKDHDVVLRWTIAGDFFLWTQFAFPFFLLFLIYNFSPKLSNFPYQFFFVIFETRPEDQSTLAVAM